MMPPLPIPSRVWALEREAVRLDKVTEKLDGRLDVVEDDLLIVKHDVRIAARFGAILGATVGSTIGGVLVGVAVYAATHFHL
jgi:hypothetical protein